MHHLSRASRRSALVAACTALLIATALLTVPRSPAEGLGYSPFVDAPSDYDAQSTCTRSPQPGTVALARWLQKTYPRTGSLGMMRACGSGGRSEHKDGRAFDWAADVARPAQKRAAYSFIRRALATDGAGNAHALARRLGIMYVIYNDTIWSSYRDFQPRPYLNSGCASIRKCSRSLRHLNHVHISLGFAGGAAQTSWYRARGVVSKPVLHPGTTDLDPDSTAVTGFTVGADGRSAASGFTLRPGVTYRIVVTGTVKFDGGALGDANCTWPASTGVPSPTPRATLIDPNPADPGGGDSGWPFRTGPWGDGWGQDAEGSDHPQSPYAAPLLTTHGLLLYGALRWETDTCRADHTYEAWYSPLVAQKLQLRYFDTAPADNTGSFRVYVARDDITRSSLAVP